MVTQHRGYEAGENSVDSPSQKRTAKQEQVGLEKKTVKEIIFKTIQPGCVKMGKDRILHSCCSCPCFLALFPSSGRQ